MTNVYLFCLTLGFVFTVVGALVGQFAGGDAHGHDGAMDAGGDAPEFAHGYEAAGGGEHAGVGEGDVADPNGGSVHLPVLSPTVLSFFVASFGGSGLLYQKLFGNVPWLHVPAALATAMVMGLAMAYGVYKLTSSFEASRMARASDAIGTLAEVSVSVPKDGMGEIAYVSGGTRQTLSAKSSDGREYKQGASVRVVRIAEGTAWIGEAPPRTTPVGVLAVGEEPVRGEPVRDRVRH